MRLHRPRDQKFKLQPIQMGGDLIKQISASIVKLQGCANRLQELVRKGKNKHKHYLDIIKEARS